MDIVKVLDLITYILPFVIVVLLIWDNYRLSKRVAKMGADLFFFETMVLGSIEDNLDSLAGRVHALETPAAPKTRAVKKPAAE